MATTRPFPTENKLFKLSLCLTFLAILDTFFTHYGIQYEHIEEANPVMKTVYEKSVFLFFSIKIALPFLLLIFSIKITPKRYFYVLISSAIFLYSVTLCLHIVWIALAFNII